MDLKMEVYTPTLELVGLLEIYRSVIWEEKAFSAGSFSVDSLITASSKALLVPDNIIWIEGATAGIIEYFHEEAGPSGPYITVKGKTLTGILDHNILWGRYDLKGTAPQIMHALVDDCCVHPTRGDTEARKIPGLVLLDPPAGGEAVRSQKTGGSLLTALEELGAAYGVAFGVRFDPGGPQMEFWTRWGQDRSVSQSTNDPVFYSRELDDVLSSEYSYNAQDYRNVALVAGEGEGDDRVMVTVEAQVPDTPEPPAPMKYTVTLTVDPQGGGTATGGGTVEAGENVTVIAAPASGFEFVGWRENGSIVSTSASYTFKPGADRALTAVFATMAPTYTIEASIDPTGSGTVTGTGRYREGEQATLRARPAEGYKFSGWAEDRPSRLPSGYAELEYIQASGTQYIDTGFIPNSDTRIVSDFKAMDGPYQFVSIFGQRSSSNADGTFLFMQNGVFNAMYGASYASFDNDPDFSIQRHVCDFNKNVVTVSEKSVVLPASPFVGATSLTLFAVNTSGTKDLIGNVRCYSCKILDNGSIVRDFVPCIGPSGVVGLYDVIGKSFYSNGGTGGFVAGPEVGKAIVSESDEYIFTVERDRALVAVFTTISNLPVGYKQVEYIYYSTPSVSCIKTNLLLTNRDILSMSFSRQSSDDSRPFVGWNLTKDGERANIYISNKSNSYGTKDAPSAMMSWDVYTKFSLLVENARSEYLINFSNKTVKVTRFDSGESEEKSIDFAANSFSYLILLNDTEGGVYYKTSTGALYSCTITDLDGTKKAEFVPCVDPNGVVGLYDIVAGRFHTATLNGMLSSGPNL